MNFRTFISPSLALLLAASVSVAQRIDLSSRPEQWEPNREFEAIHYRIAIALDERDFSFQAENTITVTPFNDGFSKCILDAETFTVTRVVDERSQPLRFEQPPHHLVVFFPAAYNYGDTVRFTVSYHAEHLLDSTGRSPGINFMERSADHPAQIFTQSFARGARHWFPCYDQPNDKATQEVIGTVRSDYNLLSNGRLVGVSEDNARGTKTFHWSQDLPHATYLSTLMAGPYVVVKDSLGSLPIDYWVYKKDVKDVPSTFPRTPEIIRFLGNEYGYDYPWAKYDQATIAGIGGGAECTSASELGQGLMHDQRAEQDFSSYGWLICHEAAHQWWGDLITCRDWTHTWLNESFGTYSEIMYALYDKGEDDAAVNVLGKLNQYLQEAHTRYVRPIVDARWNEPGENFDRHTYQKGAVLLHTIRWLLGEKPFHHLLSHFLHTHAFQPVDTHDFMTAIKEATGQNLDWFFDEWFFKPGHPVFNVHWTWDDQQKIVRLTVAQTQDTSQGVPVFTMPVLIRIETPDTVISQRIMLSRALDTYEFACDEKPLMVRFDEGNHLLKELTFEKSTDELLYQLKHDDVIGKMWSISELISRTDDGRVIGALMEAARNDPFWAVRRDALYRLAGFRGITQMDYDRGLISPSRLEEFDLPTGLDRAKMIAFFKQRALDKNSQVRAAALYGLGHVGTKSEIGFLTNRFERDDSYVAQAAALRALGTCGDQSVVRMLREVVEMDSPRNVLRSAASWALGRLAAVR
jgi:aminopeptidase N